LSAGHMEGDQLRCAYHGWCFSPDGLCSEIPALGPDAVIPQRARLIPPAALCEQHGLVWMVVNSDAIRTAVPMESGQRSDRIRTAFRRIRTRQG